MKLFKKEYDRNYLLYGGLIITFVILYLATAFVSFYHAITFFNIANAIWLSVILSFVAEIGQASVLFSILLTDNKNKFLPWAIMIILTTLQIIGNVVSSFDWIIAHNDAGLDGFKRSILFAVQTDDPEMFRIIVAWISGALLPIIALSMTGLVAQNMDLREKEGKRQLSGSTISQEPIVSASDVISEVSKIRPTEEELIELERILEKKIPINDAPKEEPDYLSKEVQKERLNKLISEEKFYESKSDELAKSVDKEILQRMLSQYEHGAPFDEPIYNPTVPIVSEPIVEEKKPLDVSVFKSPGVPLIEVDQNENMDEPEETDIPDENDDFGSVDLSNEVPDQILPSAEDKTEIIPPPVIEEETPPLPSPSSLLTPEQLDKIRQIARDNLKKK